MKATSIEQIREHLARGGRVTLHTVDCATFNVVSIDDDLIRCETRFEYVRLAFSAYLVDHWELLPIEEEKLPGTDAKTLPEVTEDPTGQSWIQEADEEEATDITSVCLVCGTEAESIEQCERCNALRNKLMFGQPWNMEEQREVWELLTGERIEWGRRCSRCECTGYRQQRITETVHITVGGDEVDRYDVESTPARCNECNGSGYTVRPTWMGKEATGDE